MPRSLLLIKKNYKREYKYKSSEMSVEYSCTNEHTIIYYIIYMWI